MDFDGKLFSKKPPPLYNDVKHFIQSFKSLTHSFRSECLFHTPKRNLMTLQVIYQSRIILRANISFFKHFHHNSLLSSIYEIYRKTILRLN